MGGRQSDLGAEGERPEVQAPTFPQSLSSIPCVFYFIERLLSPGHLTHVIFNPFSYSLQASLAQKGYVPKVTKLVNGKAQAGAQVAPLPEPSEDLPLDLRGTSAPLPLPLPSPPSPAFPVPSHTWEAILVEVPQDSQTDPKHGVRRAAEPERGDPSPVTPLVHVHIHGTPQFFLALKEVGGTHYQICPAMERERQPVESGGEARGPSPLLDPAAPRPPPPQPTLTRHC